MARRALDAGPRLIEHCALETYSVLTRLPPPHGAQAKLFATFLRRDFRNPTGNFWKDLRFQQLLVITFSAMLG